jgi:hypothetical protein
MSTPPPHSVPVDRHDGEIVLPTTGACMRPWTWPDGLLHVQPCRPAELRRGDIAVWFDGGVLRAHRVRRSNRDELVTRSDWSAVDDPVAAAHQVLGRAVRFTRGIVSYPLDTPIVRAVGTFGAAWLQAALRVKSALRPLRWRA